MKPILLAAYLIRAGIGLGDIQLDDSLDQVTKKIGPATSSDAAMGHIWQTWSENGKNLDVYAVRGTQELPRVVLIRTDSPKFHLKNGLHAGCSDSLLFKAFPRVKRVATYLPAYQMPPVVVLDDWRQGIAFETRKGKVIAITVHARKAHLLPQYLPLTGALCQRRLD